MSASFVVGPEGSRLVEESSIKGEGSIVSSVDTRKDLTSFTMVEGEEEPEAPCEQEADSGHDGRSQSSASNLNPCSGRIAGRLAGRRMNGFTPGEFVLVLVHFVFHLDLEDLEIVPAWIQKVGEEDVVVCMRYGLGSVLKSAVVSACSSSLIDPAHLGIMKAFYIMDRTLEKVPLMKEVFEGSLLLDRRARPLPLSLPRTDNSSGSPRGRPSTQGNLHSQNKPRAGSRSADNGSCGHSQCGEFSCQMVNNSSSGHVQQVQPQSFQAPQEMLQQNFHDYAQVPRTLAASNYLPGGHFLASPAPNMIVMYQISNLAYPQFAMPINHGFGSQSTQWSPPCEGLSFLPPPSTLQWPVGAQSGGLP